MGAATAYYLTQHGAGRVVLIDPAGSNEARPAEALLAALALSLGVQFAAFTNTITPDALIKGVTDDVIAIVRQDKAIQSGDRSALEIIF